MSSGFESKTPRESKVDFRGKGFFVFRGFVDKVVLMWETERSKFVGVEPNLKATWERTTEFFSKISEIFFFFRNSIA